MAKPYWLGLTAFCLQTQMTRSVARRKAECGELEAMLDDRGQLRIAAREVDRILAASKERAAVTTASAKLA